MPTYDKPQTEVYEIASTAFGATTTSLLRIGPKGKKGLVRDIEVNIGTTMVGTTTVPEVNVGSAASDAGAVLAEYARWRLGTAVGTGYTAPYVKRARSLVTGEPLPPTLLDFAHHIELETAAIPADTTFAISCIKGVDGTPAGAGSVRVTVDWF